jgi:uncharacterized protein YecA (UPF0149 family)
MEEIKSDMVMRMFRATTSLPAYQKLVVSIPHKLVHQEVTALGTKAGALNTMNSRGGVSRAETTPVTVKRDAGKVGRNDQCPCGSGRKYKKCCGAA